MKHKLFTILLLAYTSAASAQAPTGTFSVTPKVGVSLANLTNNELYIAVNEKLDSKYKAGFTAGAEVEYQAMPALGVSLGAFYTTQGCRYANYSTDAADVPNAYSGFAAMRTNLGYVQFPLLVNYYIARGLAVKAGVQLAVLTNARTSYEETPYTVDPDTGEKIYGETQDIKIDVKEAYRKTDVAIPLGLSYEYEHVVIDARYNIGLTNIDKLSDDLKVKNKAFTISVGYRFNL